MLYSYFCGILVIFLCLLFITNVQTKAIEGRIISGKPAGLGQFPWQVVLKKDGDDGLLCGGSIFSDTWVLTAAHCTYNLTSIFLAFGTIDLNDTPINMTSTLLFVHSQYNPLNLNNDISLIQLPTPLSFDNFIQPIKLVSSAQNLNSFIGTVATIAGFGVMDDEYLDFSVNLLFATVKIINNSVCKQTYGPDVVKNTTICAVGDNNTNMSTCSGDSGGPLITQINGITVQIGINSFVAEDMCTEGHPSGYVRLSSYLDYITSVTGLSLS